MVGFGEVADDQLAARAQRPGQDLEQEHEFPVVQVIEQPGRPDQVKSRTPRPETQDVLHVEGDIGTAEQRPGIGNGLLLLIDAFEVDVACGMLLQVFVNIPARAAADVQDVPWLTAGIQFRHP
ncbi:hypothetical protein D3C78_1517590 [compost metagenome]